MARRTTKGSPAYTFLGVGLSGFSARVGASVSHKARDPRHYRDDTNVYEFTSSLEFEGVCTYPEERAGEFYRLTAYGHEPRPGEFALTLADCHVRDERGLPKYRKLAGKQVPVYEVPKGIGLLNRERGTRAWTGWVWVSSQLITDMLTLLRTAGPLYVGIQESKVDRSRWIVGLTLQTTDPANE